jgi:very-short-patch-repair endonuclease/predicted transcriptional regulator of viral defense system
VAYGTGAETRIQQLTADQRGVFSLAQAESGGISASVVLKRHASGRLFRVYRGTYSLFPKVSQEGIWWSGVLAAGEGSVISHMSALRLWGITTWVGPTEVSRTSSAGSKDRADRRRVVPNAGEGALGRSATTEAGGPVPVLRIRGTRRLDAAEVTVCDGIPVTTVARTFVDVCGSIGKGQLKQLLHEAARERKLDFAEMRAAMDRARGKKGVKRLREIIDDWDPQTVWTRNEMEEEVKDLFRAEGLPEPLVNRTVGGHLADFFYPDCGLIIETDGAQDHNAPYGVERDKDLDSDLQLKGFRILRLTRSMIRREPKQSMRKVKEHREMCLAEGRRADPGWATASIGH